MKQFYLLSTLLYALAISNPVSAQITIDEIKTDPSERILKNEVRPTTVDAQSYFSCAQHFASSISTTESAPKNIEPFLSGSSTFFIRHIC